MNIVAVAFCGIVAWHLIVPGPFDWHLSIAPTWQGGLEALALMMLLAATQYLRQPRVRTGLAIAFCALYLRRHAVDVPLVINALYLEITIALGALALRSTGGSNPRGGDDYLRAFVLGLAVWSLFAWSISALGFGTARDLRWLTLLLAAALPLARTQPLLGYFAREFATLAPTNRAIAAALIGWFCVLFARTNVVSGFDPLWYGLRGEYVLTGEISAYHSLALVSPVHYFPKLYELYLQPLSGLGDFSPIFGVTITVAAVLGLVIARLLARFGVDDPRAKLLAAATCLTLPAVANPTLEPKPELIACLLVVLACVAAADWLRTRQWPALAWLFACGLLATQAKLTAIPFMGLLVVATAMHTLLRPAGLAKADKSESRAALLVFVLAVLVAGFVTARTWLLTGMPTIGPDPLFKLWRALGFELREPVGSLQWTWPQDWGDIPQLIVDWLFRPERLEHIIISWTGNVWLWLPIFALVIGWRSGKSVSLQRDARTPAVALMIAGAVLALGWRYGVRGSDGNYFIAALVPGIVAGIGWLWLRLGSSTPLRHAATISLLAFALFHAAYAFCSASWVTGTRELDLDFARSPRDTRKLNLSLFENAGMARIAEFLRAQPGVPRVLGCAEFGVAVRMSARFEDPVTMSYSQRHYTDSVEALLAYMRRFDVPYLMLRRPTPESERMKDTPEGKALGEPNGLCTPGAWTPPDAALVVEDAGYVLYRLSDAP